MTDYMCPFKEQKCEEVLDKFIEKSNISLGKATSEIAYKTAKKTVVRDCHSTGDVICPVRNMMHSLEKAIGPQNARKMFEVTSGYFEFMDNCEYAIMKDHEKISLWEKIADSAEFIDGDSIQDNLESYLEM